MTGKILTSRVYKIRRYYRGGLAMARHERRNYMALDEAYFYYRRLEVRLERPSLFRICNAFRTIEMALANEINGSSSRHISADAWTAIKNRLFRILLTSFPGYFLVYSEGQDYPLENGAPWPEMGIIEFYPEKILRRFETYRTKFSDLDPTILTRLRWTFAEEKQNISPALFAGLPIGENSDQADEAISFLDRLYEICEEEAEEGKKKAHRRWWQLYWEASGCPDKRQRNQIHKQMDSLQTVWGRPL